MTERHRSHPQNRFFRKTPPGPRPFRGTIIGAVSGLLVFPESCHVGIVVGCRCGQAFEADAWLAGKVVQCPTCRNPIVVPTPPSQEEAVPHYVPRARTSQSAETRDLKESMTTFLVAAVVIVVTVIGISLGIVF